MYYNNWIHKYLLFLVEGEEKNQERRKQKTEMYINNNKENVRG